MNLSAIQSLKKIVGNVPRTTFTHMDDPYPWNRVDNAVIVLVRGLTATSDLNAVYDIYVDIMEANAALCTDWIYDELGDDI